MNKKNLILGGVLILLIALAYLYRGPYQEWHMAHGRPDNFLADLKVDEVNTIEITYLDSTTKLEKVGDKWKIGGTKEFYIQDDIANSLIGSLRDAKSAAVELVSENPEKKNEFMVGVGGAQVVLKQGDNVLADFIVGKLGNDFTSTYIAAAGSDKIYAVKANLNSALARSDWYDRTIFSSDKDKITKIRFQYPTREFTVEKTEDGWAGILPATFRVGEDKIEPILDIMANLKAVDIPEQTFDGTGLEKNSIIIQATGDGVDNILMVGDENDAGYYYAKRGESDNIYLITEEQREALLKRSTDLR